MKNIFSKSELILGKIKNNILFILLLVSIAYIIFLRECSRPEPLPAITTTDTLIITDTVIKTYTKTVVRPKPYAVIHHDTTYILSEKQCDSLADEHFKIKLYQRHISLDSSFVDIIDTVTQNEILGYSYTASLHSIYRTVYIDKYIEPKKTRSLFVGAAISSDVSLQPSVMLKTKKQHYYFAAYDPFRKVGSFGVYWKLF